MENIKTRETLKFYFDAWLSWQREDGDVMRECAATRPQRDTLPRRITSLFILLSLRSEHLFISSEVNWTKHRVLSMRVKLRSRPCSVQFGWDEMRWGEMRWVMWTFLYYPRKVQECTHERSTSVNQSFGTFSGIIRMNFLVVGLFFIGLVLFICLSFFVVLSAKSRFLCCTKGVDVIYIY